jgi:CRP-like cAMP-binding protein
MASLGKEYKDGETIVRQGEMGDCMFVIQEGEVEAVAEADGRELKLRNSPSTRRISCEASMKIRLWHFASCRQCRIASGT